MVNSHPKCQRIEYAMKREQPDAWKNLRRGLLFETSIGSIVYATLMFCWLKHWLVFSITAVSFLFFILLVSILFTYQRARRVQQLRLHNAFHVIINIFVITGLLHYLGGIDAPYIYPFYYLLVIFVSIIAPAWAAFFTTTVIFLTSGGLILFEGSEVISPGHSGVWHYSPMGGKVLFFTHLLTLYPITIMATLVSGFLKRSRQRLAVLYEVGKAISSTVDMEEVFELIIQSAVSVINARIGVLRLLDEESEELVIKATVGMITPGFDQYSLKIGEGIAGAVARSGVPLLVENVSKDEQYKKMLGGEATSILSVPLLYHGNVKGTLTMYDKMGRAWGMPPEFDKEDLRLLSTMASQIANTIENVKLFDSLESLNKELREAQERIIHSEKLVALGEMAASVAHEVRNPLVSVGGFARRLSSKLVDDPPKQRYANIIIQEVSRLEEVLDNVLRFSKETTPNFEPCPVIRIIEESLTIFADEMLHHRVRVEKHYPPNSVTVEADRSQLKQVFINLFSNAIQAMKGGGDLGITIGEAVPSKNGLSVTVEISDTGGGIPPEVLGNIFNPFFTTKSSGTGLGLAITHRILQILKGSIELKNQPGVGVTFVISLPAWKDKQVIDGESILK